ncbi:hypothetical protein QCM77_05070 [Bradyrhizobium sp. SSUT18]|uniref:hypothetical protein n=2 Tax=unclassified Bradyrhizobium TaxID=2631580 RepID=UPI0024473D99|nr:hypothetical protein [Bradyrhizobium sp. SSUT18]MDH2399319.1 hypothetical protein [Bradyrhizobium sp. SSUT18]
MLVNSRLSGAAAGLRLAHMRTHGATSGSEVLLGVIAIRLAVLVAVGWGLTLLPRQARESEAACLPSAATRGAARLPATTAGPRVTDAAFDDMRLHD